jgi:hypothetical protein
MQPLEERLRQDIIPQLETAKQNPNIDKTIKRQNARERISSASLRSKLQPVVSKAIEEVKQKKQK